MMSKTQSNSDPQNWLLFATDHTHEFFGMQVDDGELTVFIDCENGMKVTLTRRETEIVRDLLVAQLGVGPRAEAQGFFSRR